MRLEKQMTITMATEVTTVKRKMHSKMTVKVQSAMVLRQRQIPTTRLKLLLTLMIHKPSIMTVIMVILKFY